jgi:hypothetical protein
MGELAVLNWLLCTPWDFASYLGLLVHWYRQFMPPPVILQQQHRRRACLNVVHKTLPQQESRSKLSLELESASSSAAAVISQTACGLKLV